MSSQPQMSEPKDFLTYRVIHRAMDRETEAIARMVRAMAPGDRARPRRLHEWLRFVERTLHHHHEVEDRWFFPLLERRDPSFAEPRAQLDKDHEILEPLLKRTMENLRRLSSLEGEDWVAQRELAAQDAEEFHRTLAEHLRSEEAEVIDRSRRHLRPVDMDSFQRRVARAVPIHDVHLLLPWLLDACTDEERQTMLDSLPWTVRMLHRLVWAPRTRGMRRAMS